VVKKLGGTGRAKSPTTLFCIQQAACGLGGDGVADQRSRSYSYKQCIPLDTHSVL